MAQDSQRANEESSENEFDAVVADAKQDRDYNGRYIDSVDLSLSRTELADQAEAFLNSHEFRRGPTPDSIQSTVEQAIDEVWYFDEIAEYDERNQSAETIRENVRRLEDYIDYSYNA